MHVPVALVAVRVACGTRTRIIWVEATCLCLWTNATYRVRGLNPCLQVESLLSYHWTNATKRKLRESNPPPCYRPLFSRQLGMPMPKLPWRRV